MTATLVPDSAPFNEEQRAWLNGFLAGYLGVQETASPAPADGSLELSQSAEAAPEEDLDDAAWHDANLPIAERMQLAEGKPVAHRMMAAMAQLDCGACGYVCKTYSAAIAAGEEANLSLCSPGGKETKQMLKKLAKENGSDGPATSNGTSETSPSSEQAESAGYHRLKPFHAKLIESRPLNKEGSAKDTRHVAIDLSGSGIQYQVGDALGVYPENCPDLVRTIMDRLNAESSLLVNSPLGGQKPFQQALTEDCCLKEPTDELLEALLERTTDDTQRETLQTLINDGTPDGFDVMDALQIAPQVDLSATEFADLLAGISPRLYSIASSLKAVSEQVHLTVGKVAYEREGRLRKGAASTMLAERISVGGGLRVFVHANPGGFTVPADPRLPMIMIGPGTGIAPFMSFLQEREQTGATGRNWLFFGDQHQACDFLYEGQLRSWHTAGLLTRLDTAFSRDGQQKVYVQDRMREHADEFWRWLQEGAHIYVCGDASRMASDVDRALHEIIEQQGDLTKEQAQATVKQLVKDKRYVRDVY